MSNKIIICDLISKSELREILETVISSCDATVTRGDKYNVLAQLRMKYRERAHAQWENDDKRYTESRWGLDANSIQ